ncbi:hypothetical protein HRR83_002004 [Exophiala dermatitidis]|uniref:Uncharacterized protein n=1 Tax=Exophiala dermatitidis TaxID=5970 RepID=A0AAN6IWQ5_EXODE
MHIPNSPITADHHQLHPFIFLLKSGGAHPGDDEQLQQRWSSLIGIITAIVGNLLISFALNTQRYAHILIDRQCRQGKSQSANGVVLRKPTGYGSATEGDAAAARERNNIGKDASGDPAHSGSIGPSTDGSLHVSDDLRKRQDRHEKGSAEDQDRPSYLKSPFWWLGLVLMVIGEAGNFLAYGFAPAHIVSPLGVVALISNCLIAPLMLHERFRKRDAWGVLIAIAGAVTVVLSAQTSEGKFGPGELWRSIKRWEFLLYVLITLLLIGVLMYVEPRYGRKTILLDLGLVGLFGGYTVLSTKGVSSLLSASLWKAFTYPITYCLALILVGSALMQIRYLNRALQNYDSTQVIPTQFVLFTLSVILGSAVLYRDFEHTTVEQAVKFILGCLLTFFGVYLITSGREEQTDSDELEDHEGDETIRLLDEENEDIDVHTFYPGEAGDTGASRSIERLKTSHDEQDELEDPDGLLTPRRFSTSSSVPSIAVTPAESTDLLSVNPWASSTLGEDTRAAVPQTPQLGALQQSDLGSGSTSFFTPATSKPGGRTRSVPANLESSSIQSIPQLPAAVSPTGFGSDEASPAALGFLTRSARGSISRLLPVPGPLLPPLSSSLSALVADSLLKGEGASPSARAASRRSRSVHHVHEDGRRRGIVPVTDEENPLSLDDANLSRATTQETIPTPGSHRYDNNEGDQQYRQTIRERLPNLRALSETISGIIGRPKPRGGGKSRDVFDDQP